MQPAQYPRLPVAPFQGESNKVVPLNGTDAAKIYDLLEQVRAKLPDDQKHFLKEKTLEQLHEHFAHGHLGFGIFNARNELVASCLLRDLSRDPNEQTENCYPPHSIHEGYRSIQAVAVLENSQGHMSKLLKHVQEFVDNDPDVVALIAKIAADNIKSMAGFAKSGFQQVTGPDVPTTDYAKGHPVVYAEFHKPLADRQDASVDSQHEPSGLTFAPFGQRSISPV